MTVPATIITSDCLGVARKITPNLSKSYLAAPEAIISIAQQARPNVIGHKALFLAQATRLSTLEVIKLSLNFPSTTPIPELLFSKHKSILLIKLK